MKYYGLTYWNEAAMTEPVAQELANDIFDWACKNKETATTLESFAQERGIPLSQIRDWRKKFPCLDKAVKEALPFIGNNREIGALNRNFAEKLARASLHHYSERWKATEEFIANLTKKEKDLLEELVINIKDITRERQKEQQDDEEDSGS